MSVNLKKWGGRVCYDLFFSKCPKAWQSLRWKHIININYLLYINTLLSNVVIYQLKKNIKLLVPWPWTVENNDVWLAVRETARIYQLRIKGNPVPFGDGNDSGHTDPMRFFLWLRHQQSADLVSLSCPTVCSLCIFAFLVAVGSTWIVS